MRILCLSTLFIMISKSYATVFVPISLKEQVTKSDSIVHGDVVSKSYEAHDIFGVITKVEIRPESSLGLNSPHTVVEVFFPGGELQDNRLKVEGTPKMQVGEKLVLLLNTHKKNLWVSNLGLGKYSLKKVGNDWVMVNQIFPDHPEMGHMKLSRFKKIVENLKTRKFVQRMKNSLEIDPIHIVKKRSKNRSIASVKREGRRKEDLSITWLVFIFGSLGLAFQLFKKKKS